MKKSFTYFDNAATTKVLKPAVLAATDCMIKNFANPSSMHQFGLNAENILNSSRKTIAKILNCEPNEIIFTSGATMSINLALLGSTINVKNPKKNNKNKIITTQIEHAATRNCLNELARQGFKVVEVKPNNKIYTAENFVNQIDETTILISIMHVNNENGLVLPIEEITKLVKTKQKNILIHIDCVQSFTKLKIDLAKIPVDFVSISGHKIGSPKGIGALFIRKNSKIKPIIFGANQENKLFPGTQNLPAIAGFAVAAKFHYDNIEKHYKHFKTLKNELVDAFSNCNNVKFNFEENFHAPYIVNLSIERIRSQVMLNFLEKCGFLVSSGSACARGKTSTILTNLGYGSKAQDSAIRVSFSFENSIDEVKNLVRAIKTGAKTITKIK